MQTASRVLIALLAALLPSAANAASQDSQLWTGFSGSVKLSPKWRLSEEIVARFSDHRNGLYEIENNLLLGYALNDKITLWAGYTHNPQYASGHHTVTERRAREQITFAKLAQFAGGTVDARIRTEQRWRDGINGTGWRVRPYIRLVRPFTSGSKTALVLSHESFINFNDAPFQRSGYDRMRNLAGVTTPINKALSIEFDYLNQYAFVRNGPNTMDHVAQVTLGLSL